jgi:hypothetical protein
MAFSLAAASAQAQASHPSTYGTFAPNKSPPKHIGGGTFAPLAEPQPYKPHAAPASMNPVGGTDGGEAFKPFKGTSTYSGPGAFKPYKPAKPKNIYDR